LSKNLRINRSTAVVDPQPNRLMFDEQQFRTNNFAQAATVLLQIMHIYCANI